MRQNIIHIILSFALIILTVVSAEAATFESGKTYVISQDVVLTASEAIPTGVTLIFQGGKITSKSAVTLTGNHTKIVAPIGRIFDDKVSVKGSWDIDRAYPQWFGAITYDNFVNYNTQTSVKESGDAINKAIIMKQKGEVFLPKGVYVISTPIVVPLGIQLVGERGMEPYPGNNHQGTILQSWKTKGTAIDDGSDKYLLYVNSDASKNKLTQGGFLAGQITSVRDLELYNYIPSGSFSPSQLKTSTTACLKAIYATESCDLDHVRFCNFRQAMVFTAKMYLDNKKIRDCDYVCDNPNYAKLEKLYAFDFGGLGDNLQFTGNALHSGMYSKGVKIKDCLGGTISANIIHGDVTITSCSALTYSNNHMEYGPTITIENSVVTMSDNYIERAVNTPLVIAGNEHRDKSVVTLVNNSFVFCENPRPFYEGDEGSMGKEKYPAFANRLSNASDYDIAIDNNAVISLNNVYRYRTCGISGKVYPTGIKMCKTQDNSPVEEFNDFSYALSQQGKVTADFSVDKTFTVSNPNSLKVHTAMKNEWVYWVENSGKYYYYYQIIYDKDRRLLATRDNSQLFKVANDDNMSNGLTKNTRNGVLLCLADDGGDAAATIRLIRSKNSNLNSNNAGTFSYVDIPNSNNHYLYDNGISVNGFHWVTGSKKDILTGAKGIESISFQGNNVVCRLSGDHRPSKWQHGDTIINTASGAVMVVK